MMFNRSKAWAVALIALVFVAGGATGWGIATARDPHGRPGPDAMVNYLGDALRLSDAQTDSVRASLARHRPAMAALWREVHPAFDSVRTVVRGELCGPQTPA